MLLVGRRERRHEVLNFNFSFILLLDTTVAEVVGLIVWTLELDQTAILGITPPTMQMRFTVRQLVHNCALSYANVSAGLR